MSQADGTYKNKQLDLNCYCHGGAAADFNDDGYADVVLASPPVLERVAYLKNNKDGTFSEAVGRIEGTEKKSIWSLDIIDPNNDGKFDLVLFGGNLTGIDSWNYNSKIIINDGSNSFKNTSQAVYLPADVRGETGAADIVAKDGKIALLRFLPNFNNGQFVKADINIVIYSYPIMSTIYDQVVGVDKDTVWFTLYNGNIMNAFAHNPYSVKF